MYFSSGGPTAFRHLLKPDVSAPGGEILSSTLPEFARAPVRPVRRDQHGGAARRWRGRAPPAATPGLDDTPGALSARLDGATGLGGHGPDDGGIRAPRRRRRHRHPRGRRPADLHDPERTLVRRPQRQPRCSHPAAHRSRSTDAGGGAGTWTVEVLPQSASTGASLEAPGLISLAPGGRALLPVSATASATAPAGDNFGFLVLRRGAVTRRIPYAFFVTRPALEGMTARPLRRFQNGTTAGGASRVSSYRWPSAPFGYPPSFTGPPMIEDGAERVYVVPHLKRPVVNFGVGVVALLEKRCDRSLAARLARRERRAGRDRHADERQPAHFRLRAGDRRRGRRVPVAPALLRRGRLDPGSLHGTGAPRPLPAPLLGQ